MIFYSSLHRIPYHLSHNHTPCISTILHHSYTIK
nr:MAG TPA: hypothetical protein [Caudoviricetes sp.]